MVLLAGLGNPGSKYERTRHNVGFAVVDQLAGRFRAKFTPAKGDFWEASIAIGDVDVLLLKPGTYMNASGTAVADVVQRMELPLDRLLVVLDDFQLPLGSLRIRPGGSDGGHNGLASVIYQLQNDTFPRMRCGIGSAAMPADKDKMVEFVLERFADAEEPEVSTMIASAADACESFVRDGLQTAMNKYNRVRGTKEGSVDDPPSV